MNNFSLQQFAQFLKQKREEQEITLEQVSKKTKIDLKYLNALEEGNYSVMPEVYIRAFLKGIAETIGLNPTQVLSKYEAAKKGDIDFIENSFNEIENKQEKTVDKKLKFVSTNILEEQNTSKNPRVYLKYIIVSIPILLVILISIYFIFFNYPDKIIVKETSFEEVLSTESERYKLVNEDSTSFVFSKDSLQLVLYAKDTVWIRALVDDIKQTEFTLRPSEEKTLHAKSNFKLLIGNLPGIGFLLNDKEITLDSSRAVVRNIIIDRTGIKELNVSGSDGKN